MTLLEASGLSKAYAGHVVLDDVSFSLDAGERVALIGENGAGKSTFAKILAGVINPDRGVLKLRGLPVTFGSPRDALRHGIAFIPQELAFVPELTVGENILLGRWPNRFGITRRPDVLRRASEEAARYGIAIDVERRMSSLKLADQQIVEMVKALARQAQLIILDEPTASLTDTESHNLFNVLKTLSAAGVGVLYISHRIDEVHRLSDRVDIFRNGRLVASRSPQAVTREELITEMLGEAADELRSGNDRVKVAEPLLELEDWRLSGQPGLLGVDLTVSRGEVVGIFGLRGCGSELIAEGLAGRHRSIRGRLLIGGRLTNMLTSPLAARRAHIGYVPSDRKREALVLPMSVRNNLTLLILGRLARFGVLRRRLMNRHAGQLASRFDVRYANSGQPVGELSGGNQQKVMLASRLAPRPSVIVLQEPTRGVDVGARVEIHRFILEICAEGAAVLVVTADVEEAVTVSSRLLVMREGRVVGELMGTTKTQGQALRLAAADAA